jgi:hypothetical protein
VLEYKGLLLLYPLLALVVSALLNSQYTEFHLERRLRPAYTVRWLLTSDTPEPPLKSSYIIYTSTFNKTYKEKP